MHTTRASDRIRYAPAPNKDTGLFNELRKIAAQLEVLEEAIRDIEDRLDAGGL